MFTNDFGSGCHMSSTSSGFVDEVFVRIGGRQHYLFRRPELLSAVGRLLIRMGRSWMSWSRNGGTRQPQPGSFVGFSSNNARRSDS